MRRNPELIYQILEYVEREHREASVYLKDSPFEGVDYDEVAYHTVLCFEAGYIVAEFGQKPIVIRRLTWKGHDALDELRRERGGKPATVTADGDIILPE